MPRPRRFLLSNQSRVFNPADISGLSLWYDAADAASLTLDGSNNVSQWNDKSGNSRHGIQLTTLNMPSYETNVQNGLPGVRVTTSKRLQLASRYSPTGDVTLIRVSKRTGLLWVWYDNTASTSSGTNALSPLYWNGWPGFNSPLVTASSPTLTSGTWSGPSVLIARRTGTTLDFWIDSTKVTKTCATTGFALDYIAGGLQTNIASDYHVFESMFYTRSLTDDEISAVQAGMKAKWSTP